MARSRTGSRKEVGEWTQKVVDIRRVTRVVAGGKRFSFRATVVIGNKSGKVGVGVAKGKDVAQSVEKAVNQAKKNLVEVPMRGDTIPHEVFAKHSSARVLLKPAKRGRGIIAGGAARVVLSLSGLKDISAKILGRTPNKLTNAVATLEALRKLRRATAQEGVGRTLTVTK